MKHDRITDEIAKQIEGEHPDRIRRVRRALVEMRDANAQRRLTVMEELLSYTVEMLMSIDATSRRNELMLAEATHQDDPEDLVDYKEVMSMCAVKTQSAYQIMQQVGRFPTGPGGGKLVSRRADVVAYLRSRSQERLAS